MLITSRRGVWHPELGVSMVPLDVLPREKSVELLGSYRSDLSVSDRELIAQELGDLPLALSVAGSYLQEYQESPLGGPQRYLQALRRVSPLEHSSLQQEGETYTTEHMRHVAGTFAVSYKQLNPSNTIDATALHLLARVACFAAGVPIPRDLLRQTMGPEEDEEVEDRFVKALKRVHTLGLLTRQQAGAQQMHRLLVSFVQKRLTSTVAATEAQTAVEEAVLYRMREVLNTGYPAPLLPLQEHLRTVTARASERGDVMAAALNEALGWYLYLIDAFQEAEPLYQRALRILEQSLGPTHPGVASPLNALAGLYKDQGRYAEAEPLYQRALRIWEQSLGPAHPAVASMLYGLATLYKDQGRYAEAEPLYQRALRIWEQSLGPAHSQVAFSFHELADLYSEQDRYAEAEPLYQRALRIWEQSQVPAHLRVAFPFALNGLASLYTEQGKYAEAEPLYQRALRILEQSQGPTHPGVAFVLNGLATLYKDQGRYAEAEPLYQRALRIWEQSQGPAHPGVASPLNGLATLYKDQGRYAEAEPLYQRALRIREQSQGPAHPQVAFVLNGLATLYKEQGKYAEAEPLYQRALHIWEQSQVPAHPRTQTVRANYATLLREMERNTK